MCGGWWLFGSTVVVAAAVNPCLNMSVGVKKRRWLIEVNVGMRGRGGQTHGTGTFQGRTLFCKDMFRLQGIWRRCWSRLKTGILSFLEVDFTVDVIFTTHTVIDRDLNKLLANLMANSHSTNKHQNHNPTNADSTCSIGENKHWPAATDSDVVTHWSDKIWWMCLLPFV